MVSRIFHSDRLRLVRRGWLVLSIPGFDRLRDSVFQRRERLGVAGTSQRREIGLREALIPAREALGKWYIVNRACAKPRDQYFRDVVEAARLSSADVEHAAAQRTFGKRQVHVDNIVHKNKIAPLLSVGVSSCAFEQ